MSTIPTVNLSDNDCDRASKALRDACVKHGFLYLTGHGIPAPFLQKVMTQSKAFFNLPLEAKMQIKDNVLNRGYTAFEEETLDPTIQVKGDTKEGFYIGANVPIESPKYNPSKLRGPQPWPTPETCGEHDFDCDAFQTTMMEYFSKASSVGFRVVQLLALAIGVDKHFFDKAFQEDPIAVIRLLHYAPEKSLPQDGVFACGAHSDFGMITLLLTDDNPGLQILTQQNEWIDVPPRPEAFVMNIGDMLERWTNGLFRATKHRVLTSAESERYSIPFFYEPNFDTRVECLDVCCSEENPAKWKPTTSGQHLLGKYKETQAEFNHDGGNVE